MVHLPLLLEPPEAVHQFVHVVTVVSAGVHDQGFLEFGVGELFVVPVIWIFVLHLDRVRPDLHNSHVALLPTNSGSPASGSNIVTLGNILAIASKSLDCAERSAVGGHPARISHPP